MSPLSKKIIGCKGVIVADSEIYAGYIETISEEDIYIRVPPNMPDADSSPGRPFRLVISSPSGESIDLACKVKWSYKTPPDGLLNIVAEIAEPPTRYEKFYKNLN